MKPYVNKWRTYLQPNKKNLPYWVLVIVSLFIYLYSSQPVTETKLVPTITSLHFPNAYVSRVVDGDTIKVQYDGVEDTVRLIGIDTPESVDPRRPVECFGKEASAYTKKLLTGQNVTLELDPTQGERDKYDRLLAYVFLSDQMNVNEQLIQDGYAFEYTYDLPYKYQEEFKQAEQDARLKNRGLWAEDTCNGNK